MNEPIQAHHGCMLLADTVHECIRRQLADATRPLTAGQLADLVNTNHPQAARALRRLEREGAAVRQPTTENRYLWRAARP